MRKDMLGVVTSRPRKGSGERSLKTRLRINPKLIPSYEGPYHVEPYDLCVDFGSSRFPVSRFRQFREPPKEHRYRLSPLRRFLEKRLNEPWEVVKKEIDHKINRRRFLDRYLIVGFFNFLVEERVSIVNGRAIYKEARWGFRGEIEGFYVHPNGKLSFQKHEIVCPTCKEVVRVLHWGHCFDCYKDRRLSPVMAEDGGHLPLLWGKTQAVLR